MYSSSSTKLSALSDHYGYYTVITCQSIDILDAFFELFWFGRRPKSSRRTIRIWRREPRGREPINDRIDLLVSSRLVTSLPVSSPLVSADLSFHWKEPVDRQRTATIPSDVGRPLPRLRARPNLPPCHISPPPGG